MKGGKEEDNGEKDRRYGGREWRSEGDYAWKLGGKLSLHHHVHWSVEDGWNGWEKRKGE